jgi:hypothetical protein
VLLHCTVPSRDGAPAGGPNELQAAPIQSPGWIHMQIHLWIHLQIHLGIHLWIHLGIHLEVSFRKALAWYGALIADPRVRFQTVLCAVCIVCLELITKREDN